MNGVRLPRRVRYNALTSATRDRLQSSRATCVCECVLDKQTAFDAAAACSRPLPQLLLLLLMMMTMMMMMVVVPPCMYSAQR